MLGKLLFPVRWFLVLPVKPRSWRGRYKKIPLRSLTNAANSSTSRRLDLFFPLSTQHELVPKIKSTSGGMMLAKNIVRGAFLRIASGTCMNILRQLEKSVASIILHFLKQIFISIDQSPSNAHFSFHHLDPNLVHLHLQKQRFIWRHATWVDQMSGNCNSWVSLLGKNITAYNSHLLSHAGWLLWPRDGCSCIQSSSPLSSHFTHQFYSASPIYETHSPSADCNSNMIQAYQNIVKEGGIASLWTGKPRRREKDRRESRPTIFWNLDFIFLLYKISYRLCVCFVFIIGTPSRTVEGAFLGAFFILGSSVTKKQVLKMGGSKTMAALLGGTVGGVAQGK